MSPKVTELIRKEILFRQGDSIIAIADIVNSVMEGLDPEKLSNLEVRSLALASLKEMVRRELNKIHGRPKDAQGNLLQSLQPYYPWAADTQTYIRLDQMSEDDLVYNIHRLHEEGKTKIEHAKDLDEYRRSKFPDTNVSII